MAETTATPHKHDWKQIQVQGAWHDEYVEPKTSQIERLAGYDVEYVWKCSGCDSTEGPTPHSLLEPKSESIFHDPVLMVIFLIFGGAAVWMIVTTCQ